MAKKQNEAGVVADEAIADVAEPIAEPIAESAVVEQPLGSEDSKVAEVIPAEASAKAEASVPSVVSVEIVKPSTVPVARIIEKRSDGSEVGTY